MEVSEKIRSPWIVRSKYLPEAKLRLVCFPFAGGGASAYLKWSEALGRCAIEVCSVQLPGRESRFAEPFETDLLRTASSIASEMRGISDKPFALFGHSMGAVLAFETARALRNTSCLEPVHLFVTGRVAPHMERENWWSGRTFSDREFIRELCAQYDPIPEMILRDEELTGIYIKIIKADLSMLGAYRYSPDRALTCPISALSGDQDLKVDRPGLDAWAEMTTGAFLSRIMPGGHFFINSCRGDIINTINNATSKSVKVT